MTRIIGNKIGEALRDEGLLPPHCSRVEVAIPVDGLATIQYTVFLTVDDLPKLARAMVKAGERKVTGDGG